MVESEKQQGPFKITKMVRIKLSIVSVEYQVSQVGAASTSKKATTLNYGLTSKQSRSTLVVAKTSSTRAV